MGWVTGEESVVHTKFGSVSSYMTVSVYAREDCETHLSIRTPYQGRKQKLIFKIVVGLYNPLIHSILDSTLIFSFGPKDHKTRLSSEQPL